MWCSGGNPDQHREDDDSCTSQRSDIHVNELYPMAHRSAPLEVSFGSQSVPAVEHKKDTSAASVPPSPQCRVKGYFLPTAIAFLSRRQVTPVCFLILLIHLHLTMSVSSSLRGGLSPTCSPNTSTSKKLLLPFVGSLTGGAVPRKKLPDTNASIHLSITSPQPLRGSGGEMVVQSHPKRRQVEWIASYAPFNTAASAVEAHPENPFDTATPPVAACPESTSKTTASVVAACPRNSPDTAVSASGAYAQGLDLDALQRRWDDIPVLKVNDDSDFEVTSEDLEASLESGDDDTDSKGGSSACSFLRYASTIVRRASSRGSSSAKDRGRSGVSPVRRELNLVSGRSSLSKRVSDERSSTSEVDDEPRTPRLDGTASLEKGLAPIRAKREPRRRKTISLSFLNREKPDSSPTLGREKTLLTDFFRKLSRSNSKKSISSSHTSTGGTSSSSSCELRTSPATTGSTASTSRRSSSTDSPVRDSVAGPGEKSPMLKTFHGQSHASDIASGTPFCLVVEQGDNPTAIRKYVCVQQESGTPKGELILVGSPKPPTMPMKLQVSSTRYICFTLRTLKAVLQEAGEEEAEAILRALRQRKQSLLESASRFGNDFEPIDLEAIRCTSVNGGGGDAPPNDTFVLVDSMDI